MNGVSGGGLAIDELGVRRITTRPGGGDQQGGVLNGAGLAKWEFGTTGLTTLDDQPPHDQGVDDKVDDASLKLEDSVPLKANTNGFAASSDSKPASGSVSPLVGLGGGLFSVKDFGFGFGSRRANVSVGGANENVGGEGERGGWLVRTNPSDCEQAPRSNPICIAVH